MNRRVVITGLGVISPIGIGKNIFNEALINGVSGIKPVQRFDTSYYMSSLGGEVLDFNAHDFFNNEEMESVDRVCQLAFASTKMALDDAQLNIDTYDRSRSGVIIGTTTATNASNFNVRWHMNGYHSIRHTDISKLRVETIPNIIAIKYKLKGVTGLIANACAAGTYSIGKSFDVIRHGKADVMIAGGSEAMSELGMCGFSATRSLAKVACRPFDKDRDGLVVSEGSAILILEEYENAKRRGAHIYGEIAGYGLSSDAYHMTSPDLSGESAAMCMKAALKDANLSMEHIDYINAHGTGTQANDKMETNATKNVFGKKAYTIPMSSIKSMIGHTFGASGAIEAVACSLALEYEYIPPTINLMNPDPECDLDYVPNKSIKKHVRCIMSNSYAFGGNNASIIIKKL